MADGVKWIKFMIGCTDGSSFKRMRNAKIGGVDYRDKLEAIWFELLECAITVVLLLTIGKFLIVI